MRRTVFVIEDEAHQDIFWKFDRRDAAIGELRRVAAVPWNEQPNAAPCANREHCGRRYELVEYDTSAGEPWRELSREPALEISAREIRWYSGASAEPLSER